MSEVLLLADEQGQILSSFVLKWSYPLAYYHFNSWSVYLKNAWGHFWNTVGVCTQVRDGANKCSEFQNKETTFKFEIKTKNCFAHQKLKIFHFLITPVNPRPLPPPWTTGNNSEAFLNRLSKLAFQMKCARTVNCSANTWTARPQILLRWSPPGARLIHLFNSQAISLHAPEKRWPKVVTSKSPQITNFGCCGPN